MMQAIGQWTEQFESGLQLAGQNKLDGALALLVDCVIAEPSNSDFAKGFLATLEQRFPAAQSQGANEPSPAFQNVLNSGNRSDLLRLGPAELLRNPWHSPTLRALAFASAAAGYFEAQAGYLLRAVQTAPTDLELQRYGAREFSKLHRFEEALVCWERVEQADPGDTEAAREIAHIVVEQSRQRCGLPCTDHGSTPFISSTASVLLSRLQRLMKAYLSALDESQIPGADAKVKLTPTQALEAAIREYPGNGLCYVQLASLYLEKGRDYDAEKLLSRGRAATGEDPRVRELWEEVSLFRWENKFLAAQKQAALDQSPATLSALAEVSGARERVTTEIFQARCQRAPQNAEHRFEFGVRLKQTGKPREACQQLEIAMRDAEFAAQAALEMGECHYLLGDVPTALGYFRRAAEAALEPAAWPIRKQALGRAGDLAAEIKLFRLARHYLAEVVHCDPRDALAAERLHNIERQVV